MPLVLSSLSRRLGFGARRAYPRGWRDRYADEVAAILEHHSHLGDVLDLAGGAVDAWRLELGGASQSARVAKVLVAYVASSLARSLHRACSLDRVAWMSARHGRSNTGSDTWRFATCCRDGGRATMPDHW